MIQASVGEYVVVKWTADLGVIGQLWVGIGWPGVGWPVFG